MSARAAALAAVLALLLPLLSGCGSSRIDAGRLQGSIAPTFGLLYAQQQVAMGNPAAGAAPHPAARPLREGLPGRRAAGTRR